MLEGGVLEGVVVDCQPCQVEELGVEVLEGEEGEEEEEVGRGLGGGLDGTDRSGGCG